MTPFLLLMLAAIAVVALLKLGVFDSAVNTFTCTKCVPAQDPQLATELAVQISPSQTIAKGTLLGNVTASVNDVSTLTVTGTPTGGTLTVAFTNPLSRAVTNIAIPYNSTVAATQTLVDNVFGAGNLVVGGGTLPGSTQTFTGAASFVGMYIPVPTVTTNGLTGGSAPAGSFAHTTSGVAAGTYAPYTSAVAAVPAVPVPSGTGSGGSWGAGDHLVGVTGVNANGETTLSPEALVTLTSTQSIRVAALAGLSTTFTSLNVYVDGSLAKTTTVTAGTSAQVDIAGPSATLSGPPPRINTAFTGSAGLWIPKAISVYDIASDSTGLITFGTGSSGNDLGVKERNAPVYITGFFFSQDLVGLDAGAVSGYVPHGQNLRLIEGNTTTGIVKLN